MPTTKRTSRAPDGEKAAKGKATDESRFEAFYMEVFRLASALASRTLDEPTAQDIAQEIGVRQWLRYSADPSAFKYPRNIISFVRTAVKNEIRDHLRTLRSTGQREFAFERARGHELREWMDPDLRLHLNSIEDAAAQDLTTQPPRSRETFLCVHEEGLTYEAVGERLGIEPRTARNHLTRANQSIRKATLKYWKADP